MAQDGQGLSGMGGMDGLGGMPGMLGEDGEAPSPEQLKEMLMTLKQLKDAGQIPPGEMETVKDQFKEAFGASIDEVMKDADAQGGDISAEDKELLDLMKSILD